MLPSTIIGKNAVLRSIQKFTPKSLRSVSSSPLDQFRDPVSRERRSTENVGRSWSVRELRRKGYDDLHKLWLVLYKERNMLYTESNISRVNQTTFPQKERETKVKKGMAAIKTVLGERKREAIKKHLERPSDRVEEEI